VYSAANLLFDAEVELSVAELWFAAETELSTAD
jgi:hypothetical protein